MLVTHICGYFHVQREKKIHKLIAFERAKPTYIKDISNNVIKVSLFAVKKNSNK